MTSIFEIYVDNQFGEAWETKHEAVNRALTVGYEIGLERVSIFQIDYFELTDWK